MTYRPEPVLPSHHDYPVDAWSLIERRFSPKLLPVAETLFTVSNGHIGLRGNHDEGRPSFEHCTLIAGFHETWPISHAEHAYGLARTGQTIIDAPDAKVIKLYVDDEPLFLPTAVIDRYERVLDFRSGLLERRLRWETPAGKLVEVTSRRLASLEYRHIVAFEYEVRVLDGDAPVIISSQLVNREDAGASERVEHTDPRVRALTGRLLQRQVCDAVDGRFLLGFRTANSGMSLGCGVDHRLDTACSFQTITEARDDVAKVTYLIDARAGEPIRLTKFAAYHISRSVPPGELVDRADRVLRRTTASGFEALADAQRRALAGFWDAADVQIDGDPPIQQAVRWNLFQLCQATARAEGSGVPAKGLSGHGYEGHYFWDTEIFVLPFLCYTEPRIAENLLRFRHGMLDAARARAAELNEAGALFPWRTITGEEASAYYQAGTAQYHLNADIAYALKRYVDVTGDEDVLGAFGAELLVETARMWTSLGFFDDTGRFHLFTVTGPDEYTTVVNDNVYTNLMARLNLNYAATAVEDLSRRAADVYQALCDELGLAADEVTAWRRAAAAMHVPYDEEQGIHPQDSEFLDREPWDFDATPPERYPLLLHHHPLVIYRHQVLKQADVVLAMFLLGNEFTAEEKQRNFAYYEPLTTSDSSLSSPVHSIIAAEVNDEERALQHFRLAAFTDLADVFANTQHGVHVAAAGGTWMALIYGFAGLRDFDGHIALRPRLPVGWSRLRFSLRVRRRRLGVDISLDAVELVLHEGDPLELTVCGERLTLAVETSPRCVLLEDRG